MDRREIPPLDHVDTESRRLYTLCFPVTTDEILLGFKKRGFGSGRWNGFGGKLVPGETVRAAAIRETTEESGLVCRSIAQAGELLFTFEGVAEAMEVHVFRAGEWRGEPVETEEMRPRWFAVDAIPFNDMWADDRHWLPRILEGQFVRGHFHFRGDELLDFHMRED